MNLKTIWKEGPPAGFTLDESLSVPLSIRLLVLLLHQVGFLGRRQVARFYRSYRLTKIKITEDKVNKIEVSNFSLAG